MLDEEYIDSHVETQRTSNVACRAKVEYSRQRRWITHQENRPGEIGWERFR